MAFKLGDIVGASLSWRPAREPPRPVADEREETCNATGKRRFVCKEDARRSLAVAHGRNGDRTEMRCYRCHFCDGIHVGHRR